MEIVLDGELCSDYLSDEELAEIFLTFLEEHQFRFAGYASGYWHDKELVGGYGDMQLPGSWRKQIKEMEEA